MVPRVSLSPHESPRSADFKINSPTSRRRAGRGRFKELSRVLPLIFLLVIFSFPTLSSFRENSELVQSLELLQSLSQNQQSLPQNQQSLPQNQQSLPQTHKTKENATFGSLATLFLAPMGAPEGSEKHRIELNTLQALTMLRPEIEVVVFAKETDRIRSFCDPLNIRVVDNFRTNPHGTPILKSMFEALEHDDTVESPFLGYLNADLIFDGNLIKTLQGILKGIQKDQLKPLLLASK